MLPTCLRKTADLAAGLGIIAALALTACRANVSASDARIVPRQDGGAEVTLGARKAELPVGDVAREAPQVMQDEAGARLAYRTSSGMARILYVIGDGIFIGPLVPFPPDFRAAPDTDHAMGPLFETAGKRRADLVREVRRTRGDLGVARLLIDSAYVDDAAWDDARKELPPAQQEILRGGVANGLEVGKSAIALRRAVGLVELKAPQHAKFFITRTRELALAKADARSLAVLLRAVIAYDKQKAAEIGCEALASRPNGPLDGGQAALAEAATLAIAAAGATCPSTKTLESVLGDGCLPYVRCSDAGPLSWSDTSKQDEPLCTREQLSKAMTSELARDPRDVLTTEATRPGLWAYAALEAKGQVPPSFVTAHERRRFVLHQPAEPPCDSDLAPGTACHCDEAAVRLFACKQPDASKISVGVCRFEIDDKQKRIQNVGATPPP